MLAVRQSTSISTQKFTDDLRHSLRTVWRDVEGLNPKDTNSLRGASWDHELSLLCDRHACEQIQDEAHALLMRKDADVCA